MSVLCSVGFTHFIQQFFRLKFRIHHMELEFLDRNSMKLCESVDTFFLLQSKQELSQSRFQNLYIKCEKVFENRFIIN